MLKSFFSDQLHVIAYIETSACDSTFSSKKKKIVFKNKLVRVNKTLLNINSKHDYQ